MKLRLIVEAPLSEAALLETLQNMADKKVGVTCDLDLLKGDDAPAPTVGGNVDMTSVLEAIDKVYRRAAETLELVTDQEASASLVLEEVQRLKVATPVAAEQEAEEAAPATQEILGPEAVAPPKRIQPPPPEWEEEEDEGPPECRVARESPSGLPLAAVMSGRVWMTAAGLAEFLDCSSENARLIILKSGMGQRLQTDANKVARVFVDPQVVLPWLAKQRSGSTQAVAKKLVGTGSASISEAVNLYLKGNGADTTRRPEETEAERLRGRKDRLRKREERKKATDEQRRQKEEAKADKVVEILNSGPPRVVSGALADITATTARVVVTNNTKLPEVIEICESLGCKVKREKWSVRISHPSWPKPLNFGVSSKHCTRDACNKINKLAAQVAAENGG